MEFVLSLSQLLLLSFSLSQQQRSNMSASTVPSTMTKSNKRPTTLVNELPDEIQTAHRSLCRLHLMKKPHKEKIDEYDEEMKRFKDVLKEYCEKQADSAPDIVDPSTQLKVQSIMTKRNKSPSIEEMYQVTSEVLNDLQQKMADRLMHAIIPLLDHDPAACDAAEIEDDVRKAIKLECQLSVVDTVQKIRHALAKPEYSGTSVTHSLRIIPYEEEVEDEGPKSKKMKR